MAHNKQLTWTETQNIKGHTKMKKNNHQCISAWHLMNAWKHLYSYFFIFFCSCHICCYHVMLFDLFFFFLPLHLQLSYRWSYSLVNIMLVDFSKNHLNFIFCKENKIQIWTDENIYVHNQQNIGSYWGSWL